MRGEELGLDLSAVTALTIPPTSSVTIENRSRSALDSDFVSTNVNKGALPLLVAPSRGTLEDDSGTVSQAGEIQRSA